MRHEITTFIDIPASAERIWNVLMDFPRFPEWNPFIRFIEGPQSTGAALKVTIHPPGATKMNFRPLVLEHAVNREFRWKGVMFIRGLLDGEHYFKLAPNGDASTRFTQGEVFDGILVRLLRGTLDGGTRAGFEAMNLALKQRVTS